MGFGLEVDMIAAAHELDLLTTPYVFNPDEARAMTKAGADIIVAHMGVTTGGSIGATSAKIARRLRRRDRRHRRRPRARCARTSSCSATAGRSRCRTMRATSSSAPTACHGFYGASSMERLPAEAAIAAQTRRFKAIGLTDAKPAKDE